MKSVKPIFVTGSHCSGTTWVGRMIAASPDVTYIHEPCNINHDIGICNAQFERWFTYISEENSHVYYKPFQKTVALQYDSLGLVRSLGQPENIGRAARNYTRFLGGRFRNNRALLKDPIALFSARWLSSTFNMDTIVLIRHPAAFAGSVKLKARSHPFADFLAQPRLMRDHLSPFEDEIKYFAEKDRDIVDQAALLWKLIHYMILKYKASNPNWIYVRHEDLSLDPQDGFETLFNKLGLDFSEHVAGVIDKYSSGQASSSSKLGGKGIKINRESASNIWKWKERLSPVEISRIRSQVLEISKEFYSEEEW